MRWRTTPALFLARLAADAQAYADLPGSLGLTDELLALRDTLRVKPA